MAKDPKNGPTLDPEVYERLERLLRKHEAKPDGLPVEVALALDKALEQGKLYRDTYKENQATIAELEKKQAELQGTLDQYKELHEDPKELKKQLESGKEAISKTAAYEEEKVRSEVATALGWKPDVLASLEKLTPGVKYDVEEVKVKGQDGKETTEKRVFITGSDNKKVEAQTFLEGNADWTPFKDALVVKTEDPAPSSRRVPPQQTASPNSANQQISDEAIRAEQQKRLGLSNSF